MSESKSGPVTLDVCRGCQLVWFDADEYKAAPTLPEKGTRTLPQEALEEAGRVEAMAIAAKYNRRFPERMTVEDALPLVPGLAGLPIEDEPRGLATHPWVTWVLTAVLFVLGVWSVLEPSVRESFGLIATSIDRHGGADLVTALFLHAGAFQLATNLYFLLFLGDNVEDVLGPITYVALLLAGGLTGNVLHILLDADNPALLVGASGAISAVVVFYALKFPDVQLRYLRLRRWHTMPARAGLLFWILLKVASTQSFFGRSEPSVWLYVGGAAVGLVFWWVLRES